MLTHVLGSFKYTSSKIIQISPDTISFIQHIGTSIRCERALLFGGLHNVAVSYRRSEHKKKDNIRSFMYTDAPFN
jgi:hypothetical protein